MKTIDEIIDEVLKAEGGFVDDPSDSGGATNHGVSLRYARDIGLDLDGDGDTDRDDILLVTRDVARDLYKEDFFYKPRIDTLPDGLHPQMVDIAVNAGAPRAVILLQQTLNRRFGTDLDEDGRMGRKTREAAEDACHNFGWWRLNNDLVDVRCAFYRSLAERRESQKKFLRGWLRRAESFRVAE